MAYEIVRVEGDALYIRITGVMKPADQQALQSAGVDLIVRGKKLRLMVVLENFQGWEKGQDWGDVGFLIAHGNDIARIAVVGEERWRDEIYAFLGKGFRSTEIEFFSPASAREAEDWMRR